MWALGMVYGGEIELREGRGRRERIK